MIFIWMWVLMTLQTFAQAEYIVWRINKRITKKGAILSFFGCAVLSALGVFLIYASGGVVKS